MLHKLFEFGLPQEEMINIYLLHIRSILESSAVGGHSSPALADEMTIERVQYVALQIIMYDDYEDYSQALEATHLPTLYDMNLCKQLCQK